MVHLKRYSMAGLLMAGLVISAAAQKRTAANQNAALHYWQAFALMQDQDTSAPDAKRLDAIVAGTLPWDEAKFGPFVDANYMALTTMHRATSLPYCDWGLGPDMDPGMPMAHIAKARALATLNAVAGLRLVAQGKTQLAVDTWLYGFRFARHSEDGTMLGMLLADVGLSAQLHALIRTVGSENLDDATLARIEKALRALPPYVFDWSRPMLTERASVEFIDKMLASRASLPDFQELFGQQVTQAGLDELRASASLTDRESRAVYEEAAEAFRLSYLDAKPKLQHIQESLPSMTKLIQTTLPNLGRFNDNRAELEADRAGLLALVTLRRAGLKDIHKETTLLGLGIPDDPYSGEPFQIARVGKVVEIHSVGKDSKGSAIVYKLTD
jgi:hypothetical protein